MSALYPGKTVADYVIEKPSLSRVFEKFGIDFCCGGKRLLEEVCQEKGLDSQVVLTALRQELEGSSPNPENLDWKQASVAEMIDHIYNVHHVYLYEEMPPLGRMAMKVAAVHGDKDARLRNIAEVFEELREELEVHMKKEEEVLFPNCKYIENTGSSGQFLCGGTVDKPISVMEEEHENAGRLLALIRQLSDDYTPPEWACNTYRALFNGLLEMERDIHRHIHEENNILFPKVKSLVKPQ